MRQTHDLHVKEIKPLISPEALKTELPLSEKAAKTVITSRENVENVLIGKDKRLIVIVGPCSIHDEKAALEYADRINKLRNEVEDSLLVLMRVYFEKPRTAIGWKGFINDPSLDSTYDIELGLRRARKLLLDITEMGLPTATEMLDPITPQYIAGLISWAAIGARTTESQTHREMASGLSMPVGLKNSTDGNLDAALNAMEASRAPQSFLGIDSNGHTGIVKTTGNPHVHLVLRGGNSPNYDPISIEKARAGLERKQLPETIMVDCSHANSGKKQQGQAFVWKSVIDQRLEGNEAIIGLMLESNLCEGNQKCNGNISELQYGISITDECISWETTEKLLLYAKEKLAKIK